MTEPDYPFWTYEDLAFFLAAVLPALFAGSLVIRVAGVTGTTQRNLLFQSVLYGLLLGVLYLLVSWRYGQPFWRSLGWLVPSRRGALWCVFLGPALAIGASVLGVAMRAPEIPDPVKGLISGRQSLMLVLLFVTILGPVFEELFFQGFLQPLFMRTFGAAAGIILTAVPFALLHGPQNQWAWQQITLIGLAGLAFAYARYRTGSTVAATLLHCGFNLTSAVGYVVQKWAEGTL